MRRRHSHHVHLGYALIWIATLTTVGAILIAMIWFLNEIRL